jgi:hypothetical protein
LGQASEYQNTGPKLGGLLVLDLTNNKGSVGAIEDNIKLEFINDEAGKTSSCGSSCQSFR